MSTIPSPIFKKAYASLAVLGGLYLLFIFALTFPTVQRIALYSHHVNPALWQNLSDFESFGFHPHQVQPFTVLTPDNETLYAWHILPDHLVQSYAQELSQQPRNPLPASQLFDSVSFRLLADPSAHVIVNFHGNAAHLGSAHRPSTYRSFLGLSSPSRPVHIIAFDYRGFGLSTGTPTEPGLITDAETMLSFLTGLGPSTTSTTTQTLSIPPSHVSLTSQSLGTAVATALFHKWTVLLHLPAPRLLLLTAPFSSFRSLVDCYSIKGIIPPLLSPFRGHPAIMKLLTQHIADPWQTDTRLSEIMQAPIIPQSPVTIEIFHARDDVEIPWWEGAKLLTAVAAAVDPPSSSSSSSSAAGAASSQCPFGRTLTYPPPPEVDPRQPGDKHSSARVLRFSCLKTGGHSQIAGADEVVRAVGRVMES